MKKSKVKLSNFEGLKNIKRNKSKIIYEEKPNPIIPNSKKEILWKGRQFSNYYLNKNDNDLEDEEEKETLITIMDLKENNIENNEDKKEEKEKNETEEKEKKRKIRNKKKI